MNQYEKQGFDFDPELIELFDSILQNITDEGELKDEFAKLKFIKKLDGTYNGKPGPLKQLIEKMATMEQEFTRVQLDMQRATSDLNQTIDGITKAVQSQTQADLQQSVEQLHGIGRRGKYYTRNMQDGS